MSGRQFIPHGQSNVSGLPDGPHLCDNGRHNGREISLGLIGFRKVAVLLDLVHHRFELPRVLHDVLGVPSCLLAVFFVALNPRGKTPQS